MPTLAQMFTNCQRDCYYSRTDDEIYAALDRAGQYVYNSVCNENGGFFIVFDESSLTFTAGVMEYALPAAATSILHLAERVSATEEWSEVQPDTRNNVLRYQLQTNGILSLSPLEVSAMTFYGPYLDSAATTGTQIQKIRISPAPGESHFVQLVYTAKWGNITNDSSSLMLPSEGTAAMERFASASLVRKNSDDLSGAFEAEGDKLLRLFLTWVRQRQMQRPLSVEPYLGGE